MTGIYGTSLEDRIRERELDAHLDERDRKEAENDENDENKQPEKLIEQHDYNFPSYLNVNKNFVQLIKFMTEQDISEFVYYIAIIADEKNDRDTRHWGSDQLNVFLNSLING